MISECHYVKSSEDVYSYKVKWNEVNHTIECYHNGNDLTITDRPETSMEFEFDARSGALTFPIYDNNEHIYDNSIYEDAILEVSSKYDGIFEVRLTGNPFPAYMGIPDVLANSSDIRYIVVVIDEPITPDCVLNIMRLAGISINYKNPVRLGIKYNPEVKDVISSISKLWKYITNNDVEILKGDENGVNS